MSRVQLTDGTPPQHTTIGQLTVSTMPSGTTIMRRPVNNLFCNSVAFQSMNAIVTYLDGIYSSFDAGAHAAWDALAATWPVQLVCGCPDSGLDGQRLFRLNNFMRVIQTGSYATYFPPVPVLEFTNTWTVYPVAYPPPGTYGGTVETFFAYASIWTMFPDGNGLSNTILNTPLVGDSFIVDNVSSNTGWLPYTSKAVDGSIVEFCAWDQDFNWIEVAELEPV